MPNAVNALFGDATFMPLSHSALLVFVLLEADRGSIAMAYLLDQIGAAPGANEKARIKPGLLNVGFYPLTRGFAPVLYAAQHALRRKTQPDLRAFTEGAFDFQRPVMQSDEF